MKKILRFFGILILVLLLGFLVLCAVSPSEVKVERSTTIDAPKAVVWEQIVKFSNWDNWSPWKEQDTTIISDISGTDGQQGSVYHYVGKRSGEGSSTNIGVSDGEMKYEMNFIKPFKAKADGYYRIADDGGRTKVVWYFHQDQNFFMRGFAAIMGMKGMLTKSFDRGLELMKNYTETHKETAVVPTMPVTEIQFPAHIYAGVKGKVSVSDPVGMQKFFSDAYSLVGKEAGPRINGPAVGLILNWDDASMSGDMIAAFPVADNKPVKGAEITQVDAGTGYQVHYVGPYTGDGMHMAHMSASKAVKDAGKTIRLRIEEYIKTPGDTKDSSQYVTNIIYLVQ